MDAMQSRKNGFTFIEILISVTIFSIISIGIYSSFYVGIKAWYKEQEINKKEFKYNQLFFDIESRLQNTVGTTFIKFVGKAHELYFASIITAASESARNTSSLVKVHYYFEDYSPDEKNVLVKKETVFSSSNPEERHEPIPLSENIYKLTFEYPYIISVEDEEIIEENEPLRSIIWKNRWQDPEKIPYALRTSITFKDKIPYTIEKIAIIPQGELTMYKEDDEEEE